MRRATVVTDETANRMPCATSNAIAQGETNNASQHTANVMNASHRVTLDQTLGASKRSMV